MRACTNYPMHVQCTIVGVTSGHFRGTNLGGRADFIAFRLDGVRTAEEGGIIWSPASEHSYSNVSILCRSRLMADFMCAAPTQVKSTLNLLMFC